MTGIELVASRKPWQSFESTKRIGAHICDQALSRGVLIRPLGDVIVLNPAPAMDEDTLHLLLDAVIDTIQSTDFDGIS
jgi:adenosylmethionine-8-amino-7-oxononanoate aminotransferase